MTKTSYVTDSDADARAAVRHWMMWGWPRPRVRIPLPLAGEVAPKAWVRVRSSGDCPI